VGNLERAYVDGTNRKAREAMSLGALLGGIALQAKMVYGHSIGYTIATKYKLAHGVSCGIPLPYVVSSYAVACGPKMKSLAESYGVGPIDDPQAAGLAVAEVVRRIGGALKMPKTLAELGVEESELPALSRECLEMYPRPNSPLVFDEKSMGRLYSMMWEGKLA
jgi:alcohol dehydrogenase class IV